MKLAAARAGSEAMRSKIVEQFYKLADETMNGRTVVEIVKNLPS